MFNLIVSVVSIALTSILAVASLSYGGSILSASAVKANVAGLVNAGQQIGSAAVLASLDDPYSPLTLDRIPNVPLPSRVAAAGATWQIDPAGLAYIRLSRDASQKVCAEVQQMGGADVSLVWADPSSGVQALRAAGKPFGCVGNQGETYFSYRLN